MLFLIAMGVAAYVLSHQRLNLPAWVPIIGKDFFTLKAEFQTGQALTPGQGQTVNIAGVKVGEIQKVELVNGRALVTMKIEPKYAEGQDGRPPIYRNARMLLRPKTGLKDMIIELTTAPRPRARCPTAERSRSATRCPTSTRTRSSPRSTPTRGSSWWSC